MEKLVDIYCVSDKQRLTAEVDPMEIRRRWDSTNSGNS